MTQIKHFGVKGMRWGVRKQKELSRYNTVASGKANALQKLRVVANSNIYELARARGSASKIAAGRAAVLEAQKKRIESGQANRMDKLDRAMNTSVLDLVRGR